METPPVSSEPKILPIDLWILDIYHPGPGWGPWSFKIINISELICYQDMPKVGLDGEGVLRP